MICTFRWGFVYFMPNLLAWIVCWRHWVASATNAMSGSPYCVFKALLCVCRWAKLRVAMVPFTILCEPLSECLLIGAIASWAVTVLFDWDPLVFYLVHILAWFLWDWILLSIVQVSMHWGVAHIHTHTHNWHKVWQQAAAVRLSPKFLNTRLLIWETVALCFFSCPPQNVFI